MCKLDIYLVRKCFVEAGNFQFTGDFKYYVGTSAEMKKYPITKEFREELYGKILEAYENLQKQDQDQEHQEFRDAPEFSVSVTPFEREGSNIKGLTRIYFEDSFIVNIERKKQGQGCPYRMGWMSTRLIRKSSRRTLTWIRWYNVIPMSKRMCRRFMI